jgi:hypothetical protein
MNIPHIKLKIKKLKAFLENHPNHTENRALLKKLRQRLKSKANKAKNVNLKLAVVKTTGSITNKQYYVTYKVTSDLVYHLGGNKKAGQKQVFFNLALYNYQDVLTANNKVYWNGVCDSDTTILQWIGNDTIYIKIHYTSSNIKKNNVYYAQAQMAPFIDGSYAYSSAKSALLPIKAT